MLVPIRCFTCGKVIANKAETYTRAVQNVERVCDVLDRLGFDRYCCRRMLIAHIDIAPPFELVVVESQTHAT